MLLNLTSWAVNHDSTTWNRKFLNLMLVWMWAWVDAWACTSTCTRACFSGTLETSTLREMWCVLVNGRYGGTSRYFILEIPAATSFFKRRVSIFPLLLVFLFVTHCVTSRMESKLEWNYNSNSWHTAANPITTKPTKLYPQSYQTNKTQHTVNQATITWKKFFFSLVLFLLQISYEDKTQTYIMIRENRCYLMRSNTIQSCKWNITFFFLFSLFFFTVTARLIMWPT